MNKNISIIIPTRNEEGSIVELIKRINNVLQSDPGTYEIIIVDDHSVDRTVTLVKKLIATYPLFIYIKKGKPGKAQSLIEGFSYSKYDLICMIDADLQYPPESIPEMLHKIDKGADIVVANRKKKKTNIIRRFLSNGYLYFFGRILHGFTCDVQSGMKLFRKEIVERITLNPSPWTFDLEFLLKARNAGYKISTVNIIFSERISGKTKIKLFTAVLQIGWTALKYKFVRPYIIPFHPSIEKKKGKSFHHKAQELSHYLGFHYK